MSGLKKESSDYADIERSLKYNVKLKKHAEECTFIKKCELLLK